MLPALPWQTTTLPRESFTGRNQPCRRTPSSARSDSSWWASPSPAGVASWADIGK